jgi:hypothetical protein
MRRHPLDPVSLIAGLLFTGISITLLTGRLSAGARHANLVWALGAVLLGVALLTSARRSHQHQAEAVPEVAAAEETGEVPS